MVIYKVLLPSPVFILPASPLLYPLSRLNSHVSVFALALPSFLCSASKVLPSSSKRQLNWEASLPNQVCIHGHTTRAEAQSPCLDEPQAWFHVLLLLTSATGSAFSFLHRDLKMMHWTWSSPPSSSQHKTESGAHPSTVSWHLGCSMVVCFSCFSLSTLPYFQKKAKIK